jgi:hypothetical protein
MADEENREMEERAIEYSRLFARAMGQATDSDYFSSDGKSWDEAADWIKDNNYVPKSREFRKLIIDEIYQILETKPLPPKESFSGELQKFLDRYEERRKNG